MKILAATSLACLLIGASASTLAADPAVQRLALSCASAPHAMGCTSGGTALPQGRSARVAAPEAIEQKSAKSNAATRQSINARVDNDGSRFQYDSCGCSGV